MAGKLEDRVKEIIVEQLGVNAEQVTSEASFIDDLGADSLDSVELIMAFEEEFGAAIPEEDAEKLEGYIGGLPELYRTVARMRLLDGLQYKEIAEELGMELNTVRTRIRRAKAIIEALKAEEKETIFAQRYEKGIH